jgi:ABC-type transporter Mla subunit MlaD
VVAQEVRELAGRSANAAKEIKTLIETSSTQVGTGVTLVNQTGTALGEIESQVSKINDLIQSIVTGAREQSTALAEINSAVNQMDQTTQQNAAMVEETNAATQGLSGEAVKLEGLVRRFNTGGNGGRSAPAAANTSSKPAQSRPGHWVQRSPRLSDVAARQQPRRKKAGANSELPHPKHRNEKGRRKNPAAFLHCTHTKFRTLKRKKRSDVIY